LAGFFALVFVLPAAPVVVFFGVVVAMDVSPWLRV
jgi:hypothetical protein